MQRVSQRGIDLIKKHEGLRLQSYVCPAGKWTIGYGHTRTARPGQQITAEQAEELLRQDITFAEAEVRALKRPLTQWQFDALVSFVFNVGGANFRKSTMRGMIMDGRPAAEIAQQFGRWVYVNGKVLQGLVNRRRDEAALYLS